jgi:hypothetical protein
MVAACSIEACSLCIVKDKKVLWQLFQTWYVDPFLHARLKLTALEVSLGQIDLLTLS